MQSHEMCVIWNGDENHVLYSLVFYRRNFAVLLIFFVLNKQKMPILLLFVDRLFNFFYFKIYIFGFWKYFTIRFTSSILSLFILVCCCTWSGKKQIHLFLVAFLPLISSVWFAFVLSFLPCFFFHCFCCCC